VHPVTDQKVLFLASTDGAHTGRSGYTILNEYISDSVLLEAHRKPGSNVVKRLSDAIAARISLSRWSRRSSLKMELEAYSILRKHKIDIIHYLWGDRDISFMDFFKKKNSLKLVISLHNCASMLGETFNFPKRLKKFDALILMSKLQRPYFEKAGVSPAKIHVVLHGIDCNSFFPGDRRDKETFQLLFVGSWRRNFSFLVEICKRLQEISEIKIVVVTRPKFHHLFKNLDNVITKPRLSDENLLTTYHQASCFLMTAEDATANNALLEAMACGLPIVAERVGGIPEYVNNDCALLSNPKDLDSIVASIMAISQSEEIRRRMGEASRRRAEELDWPIIAKKIKEIYNQL
jgi:glycosyltransferase involved in cell wall biosynthesis